MTENFKNKLIFLGTGTSVGVPMIACQCRVCKSNDKRDKRYRTSAYVEYNRNKFIIDCGPDFRNQMLENNINEIDAVLLTHPHRDHVAGIDDIRAFNFELHKRIDIIGNKFTINEVKEQFPYIFKKTSYRGLPKINFTLIENKPFLYNNTEIQVISMLHDKMKVFGFRFGDLTYITDANYISEAELLKIYGTKTLVINALRIEKHPSHFSLSEALSVIEKINPEKTYLTHIGHSLGLYEEVQPILPKNVFLAYDGLEVEF